MCLTVIRWPPIRGLPPQVPGVLTMRCGPAADPSWRFPFSLSVGGCRIHKSYLTRNCTKTHVDMERRSQLSGPIRSGGDESEFPRVGKYDDTQRSTDWLAFLITFPKCFAAEAFTAKPAMHVLLPLMAIVNVKTAAQAKVIGGWP